MGAVLVRAACQCCSVPGGARGGNLAHSAASVSLLLRAVRQSAPSSRAVAAATHSAPLQPSLRCPLPLPGPPSPCTPCVLSRSARLPLGHVADRLT